jgi:uncharacterized surface protein with fasciclin (FAS1) repeats
MSDDSDLPDVPNGPTDLPPNGLPPTEPVPFEPGLPPTTPMAAVPPVAPTDPNQAIPGQQPDPHWYDNRAATASVIAIGLLAIFLLVGWLVWWSDDDDVADQTIGSALIVDGSTIPEDSTIPDAVIVEGSTIPEDSTIPDAVIVNGSTIPTIVATLPPETTAATTAPATTAPATAPPTTAPATTAPPSTTVPEIVVPVNGSVWDIIATNDDLSRARELVEIAGLADALAATDPLTVFVPTNEAIDAYEATGADLTDPGVVGSLLFAHSAPERLDAAAVLASTEIATIGNDPLVVDGVARTINGANLVLVDIEGVNGFIHLVDRVLVPVAD